VWLTVKQNPWCWPIGLVMVLLYSWIFYDVKLYSDMLLQVIYAALQVYGWWQWTRAVKSSMDARSRLGGHRWRLMVGTAAACCWAPPWPTGPTPPNPGSMLSSPASAWWRNVDGAETPAMLAAVDCLDVIFVGLFLYKGLYLTAALYGLFTVIAVQGWREWRADLALRP
jgi:nicotinamide mononucleotide transporter